MLLPTTSATWRARATDADAVTTSAITATTSSFAGLIPVTPPLARILRKRSAVFNEARWPATSALIDEACGATAR
ncbi:MAG: hypothetical protein OXG72_02500 [Acidobacteria bacterium]|nr:hypothetical protein [Acidobacteriota bacterium]